jgi:ketosteroid isomerase-like protein
VSTSRFHDQYQGVANQVERHRDALMTQGSPARRTGAGDRCGPGEMVRESGSSGGPATGGLPIDKERAMSVHPNVEQLQRGYKAFGDGDMATLTEIIPENAVWHVGGHNKLTGDYRGRDAIFGYFAKLMELTDNTFKAELIHAVGDDQFAVALQRSTGKANGQEYDGTDVLVDRMDNGQAVETWLYTEDPVKFDQMFS